MACEICTRATHEWYDCPKKPEGYVPLARRPAHVTVFEPTPIIAIMADGSRVPVPERADRNADRHRPGYFAKYQRERRAKLKAQGGQCR